MASGWTNRGKKLVFDYVFRGVTLPTNFYVALCTDSVTPTADTNTLGDLDEITAGNGYTAGGLQLTPNTTDFPTNTEDDTGDFAELVLKTLTWTASGGYLPSDQDGARWAVLITDEVTVGNRQVIVYWDLEANRVVSAGQPLSILNAAARITE